MGNLMASFNAGVSGLQAAQASLNTTAHNLANAHTVGYTRQQTMVNDSFYRTSLGTYNNVMQVGMGTVIAHTRQVRNVFLDSQYRLQVGRLGFYEANSETAMEIEDMLGELEGEQFQNSIKDLWSALSSLSEDPSNIVYKDELVSVASQFLQRAKVIQNELIAYQTSLNQEIQDQVNRINEIVTKIRDLNKMVRRYEAGGESANDYRDKRNEYLDELSRYIDFEVNEEADGVVTIYSQGAFLLDASRQYYLSTEYEGELTKLLKPIWETGGDYFMDSSLAYSTVRRTDVGSLKGILVARGNYPARYTDTPTKPEEEDYMTGGVLNAAAYNTAMNKYQEDLEEYNASVGASVVMTVQSQLDMLVHGIVTAINDAFCPNKELTLADGTTIMVLDEENALIGDDADNLMGTELFTRRATDRYTEMDVQVKDDSGNVVTRTVKVYNQEQTEGTSLEDTYTLYTIDQLIINPVVLKDSSTLPVMYNKQNGGKDGYAYDEVLAIANTFYNKIGTLNPNSLASYDVFDFYKEMIGELSIQTSVWNGIITNQETTVTTFEDARQNVMGVSTEEELSNLIKFQRCYDASSRYITAVNEMLGYLIERLGG